MPKYPTKAVILAAGLGARLRPLTWVAPKPLAPLWGHPLIIHILRMLEQWGVTDVLVNLHWRPEQVRACLEKHQGLARVQFFEEQEILGTGGALRPMQSALGEEPFWIVNADIVADVSPEPFVRALARSPRNIAAAWLEPGKGPRTVETDDNGVITAYRSKQAGAPGTATFCGLQLAFPEIINFLPPKPTCSIIDAYERAAAAGRVVIGTTVFRRYWDDAGTIKEYRKIHADVRRRARRQKPVVGLYDAAFETKASKPGSFVCAPTTVEIPLNACLSRTILWDGVRVQPGARLTDVVAAGAVTVGGTWRNTALIPVASSPDPVLSQAVKKIGWPVDETALAFLGERGSNRSFWRAGWLRRRAILVRYSLERPENGRYAGHAKLLLESGVPVPRVLLDWPEEKVLALEDCGDVSLETRMQKNPKNVEVLYETVLAAAARLHTVATQRAFADGLAMEPAFDAALYRWEHELFREQLCARFFGWRDFDATVSDELARTAERLLAAPCVVVHRDFQSSNILFRRGRAALIDFQGMRPGAAAYDVASLLCDAYVKIPKEKREKLLERYAALCPEQGRAVTELFAWAAVQRLVQALGAFGRLSSVGHKRFEKFIAPAAATLEEMATSCRLPATTALAARIQAQMKTGVLQK